MVLAENFFFEAARTKSVCLHSACFRMEGDNFSEILGSFFTLGDLGLVCLGRFSVVMGTFRLLLNRPVVDCSALAQG